MDCYWEGGSTQGLGLGLGFRVPGCPKIFRTMAFLIMLRGFERFCLLPAWEVQVYLHWAKNNPKPCNCSRPLRKRVWGAGLWVQETVKRINRQHPQYEILRVMQDVL